ncbi:spermidine synthase [soil metagenome]
MKPLARLGDARAPDGTQLTLTKRDDEFMILASGMPLMTSRMHGSEQALATLGCREIPAHGARVLVGGLGMGFTLRVALDLLPPDGGVVVAELVPAVVEWNRGPLGPLAGHPLNDPRVRLDVRDVRETLAARDATFDAILLDVDNSPDAFTVRSNQSIYREAGLAAIHAALRPGGMLAMWSDSEDKWFETRLRRAGFVVTAERVRGRLAGKGPHHTIFLARATAALSGGRQGGDRASSRRATGGQ